MTARKQRPGGEHQGGGGHGGGAMRWLFSYADLITLMFVFFVVLYSMAQVDAQKYAAVANALHKSLGGRPNTLLPVGGYSGAGPVQPVAPPPSDGPLLHPDSGAPDWPAVLAAAAAPAPEPDPPVPAETALADTPAPPPPPVETPPPAPPPPPRPAPPPAPSDPAGERLAQAAAAIRGLPWPGQPGGTVKVQINDRGLLISMMGSVLFAEGLATVRPEARLILAQVAREIAPMSGTVVVESAADDAPAGTGNFDLASARASNVIRHLVDQGMAAEQFMLVGLGVPRPAEGEESGRRVDILVLHRRP